jgi:threonine dehydratase
MKDSQPSLSIIGVQTERIPSAARALDAGRPVLVDPARTLAEGIAVRKTGALTLPHLRRLDAIVTVTEEEIASAILLLLEREKTVAEGAGAVALAAIVNGKTSLPAGARTVVVVTGGNIDVNVMSRIIDRGLVQDERLLRLEVTLPDVPGALHGLLGLLAEARANVFSVTHDRTFAGARLGDSVVDITVETRGGAHVLGILERLADAGYAARRAHA